MFVYLQEITFLVPIGKIKGVLLKEVASKFLWPMEPPRLDQVVSNLAQRLLATPYFKHYYFFGITMHYNALMAFSSSESF